MKAFLICFPLVLFLSTDVLPAQVLKDTTSINFVKNTIDHIYNFQFTKANEEITVIEKLHPGQPIGFLIRGIYKYWSNYPLIPSSSLYKQYVNDMIKCIELCEKKFNKSIETEYLLTNLCARGMLLLCYSDNSLTREVIPLASSTYPYLRQSFKYTSVYDDFYFFTGLYNYYHEAYPKAYPVYKPLAILFPKGDRVKGLEELNTAAKNSIVLKAESSSFLSAIYLTFENNYDQALKYSRSLHKLYPNNSQYLSTFIINLLLVKQYDEAEELIEIHGPDTENAYFQAQIEIFRGLLKEKKYNDNSMAEQYYKRGIESLKRFGAFGNEYSAFAYFGLSRIADINGDSKNSKLYRKKATEIADFKNINFD